MSSANYRVRRATVEDLPALKALWESLKLSPIDLEKRLTEFQIVESADRQIVGALGIQLAQRHAWLHSEVYRDFAVADQVRPLLLERIQSIASNHGVFRLWMREQAPFWTGHGFQPANEAALAKLPQQWKSADTGNWLTLQLKDEAAIVSLEKEFELFMQSEKARTAQAIDQAQTFKRVVTILSLILSALLVGFAAYLYLSRQAHR